MTYNFGPPCILLHSSSDIADRFLNISICCCFHQLP